MNTRDEIDRYLTRDRILRLLSDGEIASVSTAESATRLERGAEYLDLGAPEQGVRRAFGADAPMGHILPRKAVQAETWGRILKELARASIAMPHSGGRADSSD